jgi:uncharacterized membrane protein
MMKTSPPPKKKSTAAVLREWVTAALLVGAALGAAFLAAKHFARSVRLAVSYHVLVLAAFWSVYQLLPGGFSANFNIPGNLRMMDGTYGGAGPLDAAYYAVVIHATVGFGDVYATTWLARATTMAHILFSFVGSAIILPMALSS